MTDTPSTSVGVGSEPGNLNVERTRHSSFNFDVSRLPELKSLEISLHQERLRCIKLQEEVSEYSRKFPGLAGSQSSAPPLPEKDDRLRVANLEIANLRKSVFDLQEVITEKTQRVISLEKRVTEISKKSAAEILKKSETAKEREDALNSTVNELSAKLRVSHATIKNLRETCAKFQALTEEAASSKPPVKAPAVEPSKLFTRGELSAIKQSLTILSLDESDFQEISRQLHE
jgi:predicted RNase H-like nuclease (RuvC/YqgF family)